MSQKIPICRRCERRIRACTCEITPEQWVLRLYACPEEFSASVQQMVESDLATWTAAS